MEHRHTYGRVKRYEIVKTDGLKNHLWICRDPGCSVITESILDPVDCPECGGEINRAPQGSDPRTLIKAAY